MNPFERFPDVDAFADREAIAYLDAAAIVAADDKRRMYAAQRIGTGMRVLDIGCGTGDDVRAIAQLVGPAGRAAGLESSRLLLEEAQRRGVPQHAEFVYGTAEQLPFSDESFDAVRAERVLQHLRDPATAAHEMLRVLRDGGTALTFDQDWKTVMLSGADAEITEVILSAAVARVTQPRAGSRAQTLLRSAGFSHVQTVALVARATLPVAFAMFLNAAIDSAVAQGALDVATAKGWLLELLASDQRGEFFFGVTVITTLATK